MQEFVNDEVMVLAGTHGTLRWQIWASGTSDDLMTMLQVFDGGVRVASSGFGGPALYTGHRVNEWRGRTDDLAYFVMARAAVDVSRLVAVTVRGTHVELLLGDVDARFGLRFAAAGLPDGERTGKATGRGGRPARGVHPSTHVTPPQLTAAPTQRHVDARDARQLEVTSCTPGESRKRDRQCVAAKMRRVPPPHSEVGFFRRSSTPPLDARIDLGHEHWAARDVDAHLIPYSGAEASPATERPLPDSLQT